MVPLQHVSVPTVMKLLDSFAAKPGTVRADTARNMVIIQGSGSERRTVIETVLTFDADWMRGQSVGIYPVRNSVPEPVIAELEKVMDAGEGGLNHNLVKFQAIGRQNSILVVSRRPQLLRTAATWISRLDSSDTAQNGVQGLSRALRRRAPVGRPAQRHVRRAPRRHARRRIDPARAGRRKRHVLERSWGRSRRSPAASAAAARRRPRSRRRPWPAEVPLP